MQPSKQEGLWLHFWNSFPSVWGLVLSPLMETSPWVNPQVVLNVVMNKNLMYNIVKTRQCEFLPNVHQKTSTYLWDHSGKKSKWVSWQNEQTLSPSQSPWNPHCWWRCWLSCPAPPMLAQMALERWKFQHGKKSSPCHWPECHLSLRAASSPQHPQTWMNCTRDRWWGWTSSSQHLSCLGSHGCCQ